MLVTVLFVIALNFSLVSNVEAKQLFIHLIVPLNCFKMIFFPAKLIVSVYWVNFKRDTSRIISYKNIYFF